MRSSGTSAHDANRKHSRKGVKSKSGLRFQISDFRLPQGSEIEIGTSIADFKRFQVPVLREGCFEKSEIRPAASVKKVREAFQDSPSISGFAPSAPPLLETRGSVSET